MSQSRIKKKVQAQVKKACATYASNGNCLLETGANGRCTCQYFYKTDYMFNRCSYYESHVLPGDQSLEIEYQQGINRINGKDPIKNKGTCYRCNSAFGKLSNRQKYCSSCQPIIKREQKKKYARNRRSYVG